MAKMAEDRPPNLPDHSAEDVPVRLGIEQGEQVRGSDTSRHRLSACLHGRLRRQEPCVASMAPVGRC